MVDIKIILVQYGEASVVFEKMGALETLIHFLGATVLKEAQAHLGSEDLFDPDGASLDELEGAVELICRYIMAVMSHYPQHHNRRNRESRQLLFNALKTWHNLVQARETREPSPPPLVESEPTYFDQVFPAIAQRYVEELGD